jgi:acetoacetyl-CoA synthetase
LPIVDKVAQIVAELPTVERVIVVPYLERSGGPIAKLSAIRGAIRWDDYVAPHAADTIAFAKLPFDHPVYILYSSGTTGVPKCIVHGQVELCCSTSRSFCCTGISNAATACSTSPHAAG